MLEVFPQFPWTEWPHLFQVMGISLCLNDSQMHPRPWSLLLILMPATLVYTDLNCDSTFLKPVVFFSSYFNLAKVLESSFDKMKWVKNMKKKILHPQILTIHCVHERAITTNSSMSNSESGTDTLSPSAETLLEKYDKEVLSHILISTTITLFNSFLINSFALGTLQMSKDKLRCTQLSRHEICCF